VLGSIRQHPLNGIASCANSLGARSDPAQRPSSSAGNRPAIRVAVKSRREKTACCQKPSCGNADKMWVSRPFDGFRRLFPSFSTKRDSVRRGSVDVCEIGISTIDRRTRSRVPEYENEGKWGFLKQRRNGLRCVQSVCTGNRAREVSIRYQCNMIGLDPINHRPAWALLAECAAAEAATPASITPVKNTFRRDRRSIRCRCDRNWPPANSRRGRGRRGTIWSGTSSRRSAGSTP
jgi:hypothetical protein